MRQYFTLASVQIACMREENHFARRIIQVLSSRRDLFKARFMRLSGANHRGDSPNGNPVSIQIREIKKFPLARKKETRERKRVFLVQLGRCVYPIVVFIVHYAFRSREENLFEKCSGNWKNLFGGSFSPLSAERGSRGGFLGIDVPVGIAETSLFGIFVSPPAPAGTT